MTIRYRHLWAWDTLMERDMAWKMKMQYEATIADAPIDALYFNEMNQRWVTFDEVLSHNTRTVIERLLDIVWRSEACISAGHNDEKRCRWCVPPINLAELVDPRF